MSAAMVILLAEDDDGHATLVRRNLQRSGVVNELVRVRDGQEALDYVRREGAYAGRDHAMERALRKLGGRK